MSVVVGDGEGEAEGGVEDESKSHTDELAEDVVEEKNKKRGRKKKKTAAMEEGEF